MGASKELFYFPPLRPFESLTLTVTVSSVVDNRYYHYHRDSVVADDVLSC